MKAISVKKALTFKVGDLVSLRTKHLGVSTLPSKKLFPKWLGPFTVQRVVNDAIYTLELPKTWRAHNTFHVSLLKPFLDNGEPEQPPSFTLKGGDDNESEVERICDFRPKADCTKGKGRQVRTLEFCKVAWLGNGPRCVAAMV